MRWKELTEKRRNPEVNVKLSTLDELEKYRGRDDVFVSFVSDVGIISTTNSHHYDDNLNSGVRSKGELANISGHKIGINPRSEYSTPNGIYCYPISHILTIFKDRLEEFATDRPFAYVIQASGNLLISSEYTEDNLASDKVKLSGLISEEDMERAESNALVDTPAGKLWGITRQISLVQGKNNTNPHRSNPHANKWNKIFRDLGYSGFYDVDGEKIIHQNEPVQCVFFTRNSFKILETINNRPPEDVSSWIKKPEVVLKKIHSGELSDNKMANLLYWNAENYGERIIDEMDLPEGLIKELKRIALKEDNISNVPHWLFAYLRKNGFLSEDELIQILTHDSHIVRVYGSRNNTWKIGMTPKVEKTIIDLMVNNPHLYASKSNIEYFMETLTDDQIFEIIQKDNYALHGAGQTIPNNVLEKLAETDPDRYIYIYKDIIPFMKDRDLVKHTAILSGLSYKNVKYFGPKTINALIKKHPTYIGAAIEKGLLPMTDYIKKAIANVGISYLGIFIVAIGNRYKGDALDIINLIPKDDARALAQFNVDALNPYMDAIRARAK